MDCKIDTFLSENTVGMLELVRNSLKNHVPLSLGGNEVREKLFFQFHFESSLGRC